MAPVFAALYVAGLACFALALRALRWAKTAWSGCADATAGSVLFAWLLTMGVGP